mmetsp:Transcript_19550/g.34375  ORF Transcript_19550/g.34375 Transcript_19550/m.34375 type:complete len:851 (+) Transcript_19550:3-2555(+)
MVGFLDGLASSPAASAYGQERLALVSIETSHWDSLNQLQILKPSGDTRLISSLLLGLDQNVEEAERKGIIEAHGAKNGPPQVTFVVELAGPRLSGQINLTAFASLEAHAEVLVDYDLNHLENLTISHFLEQPDCALLPAMDVRLLPESTSLGTGKSIGVNLTALINGKQVSLSTSSLPHVDEVSNELLSWSLEWFRNVINRGLAEWLDLSYSRCPGVVFRSDDDGQGDNDGGDSTSFWGLSPGLWVVVISLVLIQGGLLWVVQMPESDSNYERVYTTETSREESESDTSSRPTPLLTSFQELILPFSSTTMKNDSGRIGLSRPSSLDRSIITDFYGQMDDNYLEPQVILEEQLIQRSELPEQPPKSLFASKRIPGVIRYLVPALILGTIVLLITSNVSVGASVDLSLRVGDKFLPVPGLFQFSLGNTASELYRAGIYPLLILVVCFSGIWPYAKLFWILYAWTKVYDDQYQRERRLLTLDALGKFSLVDTYVLILFVVAFRFHLEVSESLGIDVYVTPTYGFFSFLFATCLSLVLGHAALFFHRRNKDSEGTAIDSLHCESILEHAFEGGNADSPKRLSRGFQAIVLSSLVVTLILLVLGYVQESFIFEFGGLAGLALGEEYTGAAYSVLTLGAAIPQSVENSGSIGISFLQTVYFSYTIVTPVLCLFLVLILMIWPMTIKRQRHFLVLAEIANAWSAIEVFLLSIVAALLQISTFASFMIGDKCDGINSLAGEIFGREDVDTECFTVDASVESNCWYLVVGAMLNSWLVSFCLKFSHAAVEERSALLLNDETEPFLRESYGGGNHGWTMVQNLISLPMVGRLIFVPMTNSLAALEEEFIAPEDRRSNDN